MDMRPILKINYALTLAVSKFQNILYYVNSLQKLEIKQKRRDSTVIQVQYNHFNSFFYHQKLEGWPILKGPFLIRKAIVAHQSRLKGILAKSYCISSSSYFSTFPHLQKINQQMKKQNFWCKRNGFPVRTHLLVFCFIVEKSRNWRDNKLPFTELCAEFSLLVFFSVSFISINSFHNIRNDKFLSIFLFIETVCFFSVDEHDRQKEPTRHCSFSGKPREVAEKFSLRCLHS